MKAGSVSRKWNLLLAGAMALSSFLMSYSQTGRGHTGGIPEDWTHHHVVFSDPGSEENAWRAGKMERWSKIVNDRRYWYQQQRRGMGNWHARVWGMDKTGALKTDWSMNLGSGAPLLQGQYPAKFSFSVNTASCSDYVVYPTGLAGSGTQATVVAFNNLYAGTCSGTTPGIYWAYNTGGTANTSPVLYYDGKQVAFMQTSGAAASLVILTMANSGGTIGGPVTPTSVAPGAYKGCTAPCYTSIGFNTAAPDTNSAPYYDYDTDTLYVGDNNGKLHKFIHIFGQGVAAPAPSEVTTGLWPVTVSTNSLTSPVYDAGTSKNVIVGDSGGQVYAYTAANGTHQWTTSKLTATGVGLYDAPMVDSTTEKVYVSVGDDANTATSGSYTCQVATGCSGVFQFPAAVGTPVTGTGSCTATSATAWSGSYCGQEAVFGVGAYPTMYDGAFDNTYFNGTGTTGYLWECPPSNPGGTNAGPRLSEVIMQSNGGIVTAGNVVGFTGNTYTAISALATGNHSPTCSAVTEFYNTGNASTGITYTGAISGTGSPTTFTVSSSTNLAVGNYIQIGSEDMLVTAIPSGTSVTVSRAQVGTTEAAHAGPSGPVNIPAIDYIYFSITAWGGVTPGALGCTGSATNGCLYSAAVGTASGSYTALTAVTNGVAETGGTSGIIIDNSATAAGESQIYFTTLANQSCAGNGTTGSGTGGCAIQTSQSAP